VIGFNHYMNNQIQGDWYENYYAKVSISGDASNIVGKILHRFLEYGKKVVSQERSILEIGVNNGEHIDFVKGGWASYIAIDVRTPSENTLKYFHDRNVKFVLADVHELPFPNDSFDEVIITCVLHHLLDPDKALIQVKRVLKPGGKVYILIPNDPGLSYRTVRHLTSVRRAKKLNFKNQLQDLHYSEHRNHYLGLIYSLKRVFKEDIIELRSFPFFFNSYDLNLLTRAKIVLKSDNC